MVREIVDLDSVEEQLTTSESGSANDGTDGGAGSAHRVRRSQPILEVSSHGAYKRRPVGKEDGEQGTIRRRISFSTGSEAEHDVYQGFQDQRHGKRKRKQARKETRSKIPVGETVQKTKSTRRSRNDTGAGKKPASTRRSRMAARVDNEGPRESFLPEQTDSDEGMEYTLPSYLQARRARRDEQINKHVNQSKALKVPPSYESVEFSDDDFADASNQRPNFHAIKPCAEAIDREFPASHGILPATIAQWLREYQVDGAAFLHELFVTQTGGILGDDMGLGKTVQVIAFLTVAFGKSGTDRDAKRMRKIRRLPSQPWYPRVLIICPGTLLENWRDEFDRWGWWHLDVYHGGEKESILDAVANGWLEIMMTTYSTYRLNMEAINMIEWDCVVADECHQIKGRRSQTTHALNQVNALCRIGLTGTAIQNSYDELWTLLNWTNPGHFGPITIWKNSISKPLRLGQSHDATIQQLSMARKTAQALVQNLLPKFFLRRLKSLIADQLPKKSDRVVFCPLTPAQADAYENLVQSESVRSIRESADPCSCNSGKKAGWCCRHDIQGTDSRWQDSIFPAILQLQKLSNHLAMLIPQSTDPREKQDKDLDTLQIAVPDAWQSLFDSRDSIINFANPKFCGKWRVLKRLLQFWHGNGDKVLVFSHSVRLLRMFQMLFQHTSFSVSFLDGSMKYEDRAKAVADFNSDPNQFVFLISTKAGGVGLNITSANKVVVVDPNWNPAYDLQAQDRAYRIGQMRDVEVFRLVSAGTIEEIVYARQIYKQQQANIGYTASHERRYFKGVQENKDQKGELFGLKNLFTFQEEKVVLREIVNNTNVAESKAGVAIAGVEFKRHDGFEENANADPSGSGVEVPHDQAISEFATAIIDESQGTADRDGIGVRQSRKTPKIDPIQAILAGAGVQYTHENSEVIGSSKVEASLSKRAQVEGDRVGSSTAHVFAIPQTPSKPQTARRVPLLPLSNETGGDDDAEQNSIDLETDHELKHGTKHGTLGSSRGIKNMAIRWQYHPPMDVMQRQLGNMAATFGFEGNIVEFALIVENWTQEERRNFLDQYYQARRSALENDRAISPCPVDSEETPHATSKSADRGGQTISRPNDTHGANVNKDDEDACPSRAIRHEKRPMTVAIAAKPPAKVEVFGAKGETEDNNEIWEL